MNGFLRPSYKRGWKNRLMTHACLDKDTLFTLESNKTWKAALCIFLQKQQWQEEREILIPFREGPLIFTLLLIFSETWADKITIATLLQTGISSALYDCVLQGCKVVAVWKDSSKYLKNILNVSLKHLEENSLETETFRKGPETAVRKSPFQLHKTWQVWVQLCSQNFNCQR